MNAPTLPEELEFYYEAFHELSTERQIGMGVGPIPFLAILAYARHYDLDYEETEVLIFFIRQLDAFYLKYAQKKADKK